MLVTLYGELIRRFGNEVLFSVAVRLGDAARFGIRGQVWFPMNQVRYYLRAHDGFDAIECHVALAQLKGQSCPCS